MKKATGFLLLIVLVVSLVVIGCGGYQAPAPTPAPTPPPAPAPEPPAPGGGSVHQVTIQNFAFSPAEITIEAGDTVTWTQQDAVHHTATGGIFDSGDLGQGQTHSITFDKAGDYDYTCSYHPNMKGRVIVE